MRADRLSGGALVLLALFALVESRRLPLGTVQNPGPAALPVLLALLLLVFGAGIWALGGGSQRVSALGWGEARHALLIFVACGFAALALERLGYRLTVALLLGFLVGMVERRRLLTTAAVALGVALGSFWLFDTLLRVRLPRGPWGF
jgi:hypothetical protein